ncbi:MAG: bifunctional nuclease family protein [Acidimicrobiia bacterium]|nr:bifunctional nuclease family protein [Acidimicrobiia bacterium]MCY4456739.1 bifunctional nuclease family protein [Acidimicrobiaceae bacterium]
MQEMDLIGVRVEMPTNAPMVLLRERNGSQRIVPIYIGAQEATAIALALDGVDTPRPMTHDLMRDLLNVLAVDMLRVVITSLRDKTFFAELHLQIGEQRHLVSCRPSDAIALAVRTSSDIYAADEVLDEVGFRESDIGPSEQSEEVVEEFKEFLDNISPEDFEDRS